MIEQDGHIYIVCKIFLLNIVFKILCNKSKQSVSMKKSPINNLNAEV